MYSTGTFLAGSGWGFFLMAQRLLKYVLVFSLLIGVSAGWVSSVRAEFVVDLYGGLAKTDGRVEGEAGNIPFSGGAGTTSKDLKEDPNFKDAFTVGGRVTYWLESIPWLGLALDSSYFKAKGKNPDTEIPVYGFSLLMMMRYPLFPNEQFPQGRLQPYLGLGPELAFSNDATVEFEDNGVKTKFKENINGFGVDVRTGMLWPWHHHWGLFTEYRFTYLDMSHGKPSTISRQDEAGSIDFEDMKAKLTTHHFLVGLSYRF